MAERLAARAGDPTPSPRSAGVVDRALVLLADHELATSTLAVRVAGSTWRRPVPGVRRRAGRDPGPAARRRRPAGPRAARRVRAARAPATVVARRLQAGERLPGFGHKIYKGDDPRLAPLLEVGRRRSPTRTAASTSSTTCSRGRGPPDPAPERRPRPRRAGVRRRAAGRRAALRRRPPRRLRRPPRRGARASARCATAASPARRGPDLPVGRVLRRPGRAQRERRASETIGAEVEGGDGADDDARPATRPASPPARRGGSGRRPRRRSSPSARRRPGVAGSSPPAISSAAIAPRWATPISTTTVPPTLASDRQSTSGSPARRWPVTTVNAAATPRWVTGTPAAAGAATADVMPGTTSNGDAGVEQRLGLLAAATEHERVAALEAHDAPALRGPARRAASRSAPGAPAGPGRLPTSISSAVGGTSAEHAVADERVVHDDVGRGEQAGRLDRQQVGVAGPGADERRPAIMRRRRRRSRRAARRGGGRPARAATWRSSSAPTPSDQSPNAAPVVPTRRSGRSTGASVAAIWSSGTSARMRSAEAVAGRRAADVDVVALLGPPDDADLGVVRAGAPVRAAGHVEADRRRRRCRCRRAPSPARSTRSGSTRSASPRAWPHVGRAGQAMASRRSALTSPASAHAVGPQAVLDLGRPGPARCRTAAGPGGP